MKKRILISVLAIVLSAYLSAQDLSVSDRHEIGISVSSFSPAKFGMQFKTGINENTMLRIGLFNLESVFNKYSPGISNDYPENRLNLNLGLEAGFERRSLVAERLELMYGIGLNFRSLVIRNYANDPNLPVESRSLVHYLISPGIGINFGVNMKISENFILAAELLPYLAYYHRVDEQLNGTDVVRNKTNGVEFVMDSETVRLSFIFRWHNQ